MKSVRRAVLTARVWLVAIAIGPSLAAAQVAAYEATLIQAGEAFLAHRMQEALDLALEASRQPEAQEDRPALGTAKVLIGLTAGASGDPAAAGIALKEAAYLFAAEKDYLTAWLSTWMVGEAALGRGRSAEALAHFETAGAYLEELRKAPPDLSVAGFLYLGKVFGPAASPLGPADPSMIRMIAPAMASFLEGLNRSSQGAARLELGQLEAAEEDLRRAESLQGIFGGLVDTSLENIWGDLRRAQWRLAGASEHYKRAWETVGTFDLLPFARDSRMKVRALRRLAEIESLKARPDEALRWLARALELAQKDGDLSRQAAVISDRAQVLQRAGRFELAEESLREGLVLAESAGNRYQAAVLTLDLGQLARLRGNLGEAVRWIEKALERFTGTDAAPVVAVAWTELAQAYLLLGNRAAADTALREAERAAVESDLRLHLLLTQAVSSWQRVVLDGEAEEEVQAALAAFWEHPEASTLDLPPEMGQAFQMIARTVGGGELTEEELGSLEELLSSASLPVLPVMPAILLGRLAFREGDFLRAREIWTTALETMGDSGNRGLASGMMMGIGVAAWMEGDRQAGIDWMGRSTQEHEAVLDELGIEELIASAIGHGRRLGDDLLVSFLAAEARPAAALLAAERVRARGLRQVLTHRRVNLAGGNPELVKQAEALRVVIEDWQRERLHASPRRRDEIDRLLLPNARADLEGLQVRLKATHPAYAAMIPATPAELEDLQSTIGPGRAAIVYYLGELGAHAWWVEAQAIRHVRLEANSVALARQVERLVAELRRRPSQGMPSPKVSEGEERASEAAGVRTTLLDGSALYQTLLSPFAEELTGVEKLVVVPHGPLHALPFAALRNPESRRYLIEEKTLTTVPALSTLELLDRLETPVDGGALVVGAPVEFDPAFGSMEYAESEARSVARRLAVEPLLGEAVTESILEDLRGRIDLVHIVAHGEAIPGSGSSSRLILSPEGAKDGYLEVHEILTRVDLAGVNLVVLSACESQVGEGSASDDLVSLARAFLHAGSPGVISTLWKVDDRATERLMIAFYDRLLQGRSVAEALRHAQLFLAQGDAAAGESDYRDPFYWAAFTLNGDPRGRWAEPAR